MFAAVRDAPDVPDVLFLGIAVMGFIVMGCDGLLWHWAVVDGADQHDSHI